MATLVRTCEIDTNGLSMREVEVLEKTFDQMNDKQIANQMGLSVHTIQSYKKRIRQKKHLRFLKEMFKTKVSKTIVN